MLWKPNRISFSTFSNPNKAGYAAQDAPSTGVYKSVSDLGITIIQPRDVDFRSRTTSTELNFFAILFACVKNTPFNYIIFYRETERKTREIKRTVFGVCNTNDNEI